MPILSDTRIPFGVCDIYVDGTKLGIQADKAILKIVPTFKSIKVEDFGDGDYDKRLSGYTVTFDAVMGTESAENLRYGLVAAEIVNGTKTAYTDAQIGTSMRSSYGKPLRIHPRELADDNLDYDANIFLAIPSTQYERDYSNDQSKVKISLDALPKNGFDVSKPENFFRIGDPGLTAAVPTISSLNKTTLAASTLPTVLIVTGTNYVSGSQVLITTGGTTVTAISITYDATHLTVMLPASLTAGAYTVQVKNGPATSTTTPLTLT
ncbi:IPT/TIG domain-containing protein [Clostridium pasteurianum]|uniref:Uncharacterized protein n=1 Tax=Clostridium pasteurianum BC1 TaxID=86416 RepID=R4K6U2_CLOPA|nr:IPT/TIG domain-containing protein [Clostridium pasteurianum]AGK97411.1 hypothetical protein Clopa_2551 [Clostridium pasteurianum BC1]